MQSINKTNKNNAVLRYIVIQSLVYKCLGTSAVSNPPSLFMPFT